MNTFRRSCEVASAERHQHQAQRDVHDLDLALGVKNDAMNGPDVISPAGQWQHGSRDKSQGVISSITS